MQNMFQCELQEDNTVTNEAHKLADDTSTSTSKLANGKFFVRTHLQITLKTEKERSNLK